MIRYLSALLLWALFAVALPFSAAAQEAPASETEVSAAESFARLAQRAEDLAARNDASLFAISRYALNLLYGATNF